MNPEVIRIQHIQGDQFSINGEGTYTVTSPYDTEYSQDPSINNLMEGLLWYLEETHQNPTPFLKMPHFEVHKVLAKELMDALKVWGSGAAAALFSEYKFAEQSKNRIYEIVSDEPVVLGWPWEHLQHAKALLPIGRASSVVRKLPDVEGAECTGYPTDKLNILLVTSRDRSQAEVGWRAVSLPMLKTLESGNFPVEVTVLRPPTFEQLREVLSEHSDYFHVLHFDGHGLDNGVGNLYFPNEHGEQTPVPGEQLGELLAETQTPLVVLNACQSGKQGPETQSVFSSVATALIGFGVPAVIGMSYSLQVDGAKHFIPDFYRALFKSGSVHEAVRQGRRTMAFQKKRGGSWGECELQDWMIPVLYQSEDVALEFDGSGSSPWVEAQRKLPAALQRDPRFELFGRDWELQELEYATQRSPAGLIIQGPPGIGKTALVQEYLRWRAATQGIGERTIGIDASQYTELEPIIEQLVGKLDGTLDRQHNLALKLQALEDLLQLKRQLIVLDNLRLTEDEAKAFNHLLRGIRKPGGSKLIITTKGLPSELDVMDLWMFPLHPLEAADAERLFVQRWLEHGYAPDAYRRLSNVLPTENPGFLVHAARKINDYKPSQIQIALQAMGNCETERDGDVLSRRLDALLSGKEVPPVDPQAQPPTETPPVVDGQQRIPKPPQPQPNPVLDAELADLLLSLFGASEIRRFVLYGPEGRRLASNLPTGGSPRDLVTSVVSVLFQEGLIDEALFQRLHVERPYRTEDIDRVRQIWQPHFKN